MTASSRLRPWKICCSPVRRNGLGQRHRCKASRAAGPRELLRSGIHGIFGRKTANRRQRVPPRFHNFSDDDVLLDTGISFPIAFSTAEIFGEEIQIALPRWGRFSGVLSYANQLGTGQGPITGGLFLGDETSGISDTSKFPISQDQRNTARARVRFQATARLWFAASAGFGSGLPVDLNGPVDPGQINFLLQQYGAAILNQVNFGAGRVRPNFSLDASAGATLYHKEGRDVTLKSKATT